MKIDDEETFDKIHSDLNCIGAKKPNDKKTSILMVQDVIHEENSSKSSSSHDGDDEQAKIKQDEKDTDNERALEP